MVANADGIDAIVKRCDLIAAPLGDLTDEEFRKKLITEAFKLAGTGGPTHQFEGHQDCKFGFFCRFLIFLILSQITNRRFSFFHDVPFLKVFGAW